MHFKVEVGLMDLWKLHKLAQTYALIARDETDKQAFLEVTARMPDELKLLDLQDPEMTIDVE